MNYVHLKRKWAKKSKRSKEGIQKKKKELLAVYIYLVI